MNIPSEKIEHLLDNLDRSVPRLLKENQGVEFWIEFLERADAIKQQAGLDNYGWVATRIEAMPVKYGARPPSRWMHN